MADQRGFGVGHPRRDLYRWKRELLENAERACADGMTGNGVDVGTLRRFRVSGGSLNGNDSAAWIFGSARMFRRRSPSIAAMSRDAFGSSGGEVNGSPTRGWGRHEGAIGALMVSTD
jgi:hypothetical protein